jgi:hypothetical protein
MSINLLVKIIDKIINNIINKGAANWAEPSCTRGPKAEVYRHYIYSGKELHFAQFFAGIDQGPELGKNSVFRVLCNYWVL